MRAETLVMMSASALLTVASAAAGGSALVAARGGPTTSASPAATASSAASPSATPTSSPPGTPSPSPSASPTFTLGWYPADSADFNLSVISALPVKPQLVNYYSGWGEQFNAPLADAARSDGIETFVEMEPWNCGSCHGGSVPAMTDIASGGYDDYLISFGKAIETFGHPVLATFAHEMNGGWYPWGQGGSEQTTPAQWIAAWDHVVTVINAQAPGLVTWVWAPNVELGAAPVAQYWPGSKYVGEVGIDGYLNSDSATYQSEFGQTVADVRAITKLPIWISETGVNQDSTTGKRLTDLARAVEQAGVTGLLYFSQGSWTLTAPQQQALAAVIGPWMPAPMPTPTPTPSSTATPTPTPTPTPTVISPSTPTTSSTSPTSSPSSTASPSPPKATVAPSATSPAAAPSSAKPAPVPVPTRTIKAERVRHLRRAHASPATAPGRPGFVTWSFYQGAEQPY